MKIGEATKQALECDGYMRRESARDIPTCIHPTHSKDVCIELVAADVNEETVIERRCRWWHPTASDLIADDWTVLLGNEWQDYIRNLNNEV